MTEPFPFLEPYFLSSSTAGYSEEISESRICKFCGADSTTTTFRNEAHIIPELLGGNGLISHMECDRCNSLFSAYESHLAILFRPYLTMLGVKGKKGVPEFQSRTENHDEETRTSALFNDGNRQLLINHMQDLHLDKEEKKMSVTFRLPPHKPIYVYKALVKIALSIMPAADLKAQRNTISWLLNAEDYKYKFPIAFVTILHRKRLANPYANLLKAKEVFVKDGFIPEHTFIISFGNVVVQIFLPVSDGFDLARSNGMSPEMNVFPASAFNYTSEDFSDKNPEDSITIPYNFRSLDLSSHKTIYHDEVLNFSFSDVVSNYE